MKLVLGVAAVAAMCVLTACEQHMVPTGDAPKLTAAKTDAPKTETPKSAAPIVTAPAMEIVIDDKDAGFKEVSGKWNTAEGDYHKSSVHWAVKADDATAVASWTPTIVVAGEYEVFEYHGENPSNDHATNAPYTIKYDGGSKDVAVNQTEKIGQWNSLGKFKFAAGTSGSVTITNKANDNVIADAVKFVKK